MDLIYTLAMLIPVVLVAAFVIHIVKGYFLDGRDLKSLNLAAIVPAIVILMVAVLMISSMAQTLQNQDFRYDAEDGELVIYRNISESSEYPWDAYAGDVTSLIIMDGVTSIPDNAFISLTSLETLSIPDTLEGIDASLFNFTFVDPLDSEMDALTPGIYVAPVIFGNLSEIMFKCDPALFTYNETGTEINGLTEDGTHANILVIPATSPSGKAIQAIVQKSRNGDSFSFGEGEFNSVVFVPGSIDRIGENAFTGATALIGIILPDTLSSIGANAFEGCTSLQIINFPASVTFIGSNCFLNCSGITYVDFASSFASAGLSSTAFSSWTFYDFDGTTVLDKTDPSALAGWQFIGTAAKLVKNSNSEKSIKSFDLFKPKADSKTTEPSPAGAGGA